MPYPNETPFTKTPYPSSGNVSSAAEEAYRSGIPDGYLEILVKALSDENADGTLQESFQVDDDGGLDIEVSAGQGFVGGLVIESDTPTAKAGLTDNTTNYIYLKTTATTKRDQTFTVEVSLSGAGMSDAILIASVTTLYGDIDTIDNAPENRAPYIPPPLQPPSTISDIPGWRVVAPSGGMYTDPRAAIQACNAGDTVLICPGSYDIANSIVVPANNITIIGANRDAAVLNSTGAGQVHLLNLNGKDGVRIAHVSLVAAAGNTGDLIYGSDAVDDCQVENCSFTCSAGGSWAVYFDGGSRNRILRCKATSSQDVVFRMKGAEAECRECVVNHTGTANSEILQIPSADRCVVEGNWFKELGTAVTYCIEILHSNRFRVVGNTIEVTNPAAAGHMIRIRNYSAISTVGGVISRNLIKLNSATGGGIHLSTVNPLTLAWLRIADNTVLAGATGIRIDDTRCQETRVHDNNVLNCTTGVSDAGSNTNSVDNT